MYASHSWSVCSHSIVQDTRTPLHYAAQYNKSAQVLEVVERLLERNADVNAVDDVSAWDGDGVGWHVYGYV